MIISVTTGGRSRRRLMSGSGASATWQCTHSSGSFAVKGGDPAASV
jgi:hypothetical protein